MDHIGNRQLMTGDFWTEDIARRLPSLPLAQRGVVFFSAVSVCVFVCSVNFCQRDNS